MMIHMKKSFQQLTRQKYTRFLLNVIMIVASAFMQVYILKVFMEPCNLISGGFTGLSLLINKIGKIVGFNFPVSLGILVLNTPAAYFCGKNISKRFVFLSTLQYVLVSFLIIVLDFEPFFDSYLLNILFGGYLWGVSISLALRAGGSTGGTDFIAQFVSSKINKSIWDYVFAFNCLMYIIFGMTAGWIYAGYSILFQFISTKTISSLYQRYSQMTIEFITKDPDPVIDAFMTVCRHGMSVFEGYGAYKSERVYLCKAVVSVYEAKDIIVNVRTVDPNVIVNTYKTVEFYGNFYHKPID